MGQAISLFKETVSEWSSDRASRLAAALAFYTTFFIAPFLYLGRSAVASTYGAAGALAALLIWVYYSAQILRLGAKSLRYTPVDLAPTVSRLKSRTRSVFFKKVEGL